MHPRNSYPMFLLYFQRMTCRIKLDARAIIGAGESHSRAEVQRARISRHLAGKSAGVCRRILRVPAARVISLEGILFKLNPDSEPECSVAFNFDRKKRPDQKDCAVNYTQVRVEISADPYPLSSLWFGNVKELLGLLERDVHRQVAVFLSADAAVPSLHKPWSL